MYDLEPVETCTYVNQPLNFTEAYHIEHVHHWPGLVDSIGKAFNARITGVFTAPIEGEYQFHVWSTNAVTLAIDEVDILNMGYAGSSINNTIVTVNLTQGAHLFEIFRTQSDLFATLQVMWATTDQDWKFLTGETLTLHSRAPSYMTLGPVSTIVNVAINGTKPAFRGTYGNEFSITPTLPSGLNFNPETGAIFGQLAGEFYGDFVMTATNPMGTATAPFTLLVGNQAANGLVGRYYRVQDNRDVCTNGFDLSYADLYAVREQTTFQYDLQPRNSWWPFVPAAIFQTQAYVEWSGLLFVNVSGLWNFRIRRVDIFEFYVDDVMVGQPTPCQYSMNDKYVDTVLMEGYHRLRIVWATNRNPFRLIIDVQSPDNEDYRPMNASDFKHFPSQPFYSSTYQNQLLVGSEMEAIHFRFFGLTVASPQYEIEPSLPDGITLSQEGMLIGMPTTPFDWTLFTVTVQHGGRNFTTTVLLSAVTYAAPTEVLIMDGETPVTELTLAMYEQMPSLNVTCNEPYCSFVITPALPASLEYTNNYMVKSMIHGYPTQVIEKTVFTVTASTPGGSATATFSLGVPPCQHGKYIYGVGSGDDFDIYFHDIVTGAEVAKYEAMQIARYGFHTCLPFVDYTVRLRIHPKSQARKSLSFTLTREDGLKYFSTDIFDDQWFNTTLEMIPKTAPMLTFQVTQAFLLPNEPINIPYNTTGVFVPLYTTPEQPYITMNADHKTIEGSFKQKGIYVYSIVCENDAGRSVVPFTFYVGKCPEETMMVFGSKPSPGRDNLFHLEEAETGKVQVHRSLTSYDPNEFMFCIDQREYQASFTPDTSMVTAYYHPVTFTHNDQLLGVFEFNSATATPTRFRLLTTLGESTSWRMWRSTKNVAKKWKTADFNDGKWESYTAGQDVHFADNIRTVYLRSKFTYTMADPMAAMRVYLRVEGGLILYLNGNEALRVNLPVNDVTPSTQAYPTERLGEKGIWVWLNPALLVEGENLIAVETHVTTTSTPSNFKVFVSLVQEQLTGNQFLVSYDGEPSSTAEQPGTSGRPEAAFDENDYSTWYSDSLPATLRLTFPENERRYANRLLLRGTKDDSNLPVQFEIRGVLNDTILENGFMQTREVSDVLAVVNNPYLFPQSYENYIFKFYPSRPYQAYEIRILHTNKAWERVDLNYVKFYAEKEVICPATGKWTPTLGSSKAYGKCGFLQLGKSQRECMNQDFQPVWSDVDMSTCLTRFAGKEEAFLDVSYRIYNCTMELFESVVEEAFRSVLVREMTVKEEDVLFYLPHSCSEETDYPSVCLDARLRPHRLASEYVKMELEIFHQNATGLFYKKPLSGVPPHLDIQVWSEVVLRERPKGGEIAATITIVVLSIACIVLLYMYGSLKRSGELRSRKTLNKSSNESVKQTRKQLKIQERLI